MFNGDCACEFPEFIFGVHCAGGIESSAQFSIEAFDEIGGTQNGPEFFGLLCKEQEGVRIAAGDADSLWIQASPFGLQASQGAHGEVFGVSPVGGREVGVELLAMLFAANPAEGITHFVDDAELMRLSQRAADRRDNGFMFIGYDQSDAGAVKPSLEKIFNERGPSIITFSIAKQKAQDSAFAGRGKSDCAKQCLTFGRSGQFEWQINRIKEEKLEWFGYGSFEPCLDVGQDGSGEFGASGFWVADTLNVL